MKRKEVIETIRESLGEELEDKVVTCSNCGEKYRLDMPFINDLVAGLYSMYCPECGKNERYTSLVTIDDEGRRRQEKKPLKARAKLNLRIAKRFTPNYKDYINL